MALRVLAVLFSVAVLLGIGAVVWIALDLPPSGLALQHGFLPAGGPTGRVLEVEGVEFVELKAGYFRMGSFSGGEKGDTLGRVCKVFHLPWGKQPKESGDEVPVHWVSFRRPYWIARTEVTNEQYERYDPQHRRRWPGDRDPVTSVSWEDTRAYCEWLSRRGALAVRLPTEAEWEAACRAGSRTEYSFGDDEARLGEYGWFGGNAGGGAHEVGTRAPNAWGLHDMHGNVWEWVEDTYHKNYEGALADGSAWTEGGEVWGGAPVRVRRGGGWRNPAVHCRSADRFGYDPGYRGVDLGFRPAASASH